jgi:hypothetical protein
MITSEEPAWDGLNRESLPAVVASLVPAARASCVDVLQVLKFE